MRNALGVEVVCVCFNNGALGLGSDGLCLHGCSDERIGIGSVEQIDQGAILQFQTPLCCLELWSLVSKLSYFFVRVERGSTHNTHPCRSMTLEPHLRLLSRSLDPVNDINLSMQLVDLSTDIRNLACKVHFISKDLSCQGICSQ